MGERNKINRREFLKLAGLFSFGATAPLLHKLPTFTVEQLDKKNILIIVFDALSASHISTYGYARETMPNLSRLVDRAIVYHNHFSGGNFTTPGTASLLTGTLPWTNRATQHNGKVAKDFLQKNIFHLFQNYHRIAYSHNLLANTLLKQFSADIDNYVQRDELLLDEGSFIYSLFKNDEDIVSVSWLRAIQQEEGFSYSLFSPRLYGYFNNKREAKLKDIRRKYPLGIPYTLKDDYYVLEQAIDYLQSHLLETQQPFLGYFHFFPPHAPYHTRKEFIDQFSAGLCPFWIR